MFTTVIQPPRLHFPVHNRNTAHIPTGRRRRRTLTHRIHFRTSNSGRTSRVPDRRQRTTDTPGSEYRPATRETFIRGTSVEL
jgi:hypothetical protein